MDDKKKKELLQRRAGSNLTVVASQDEPIESRKGMKRGIAIVLFVVVVVLIVLGIGIAMNNRSYDDYQVLATYEIDDVTSMDYLAYGDNYIKYSKDGISYVDKSNHTVWMESYAMKMPTAVVAGNYIAVADLNGNEVYLFGKEGKLNQTTTTSTIIDVDVALQGVFAVVLDGTEGNLILTYDKHGEKIAEISTTVESSGYPLDISLSEDGRKLFTSFAYFEGTVLKNQLGTYNFGEIGKNENADRFMGGFDLTETLVTKVEFIGNDAICAFGDNQLLFYSMKEKPSEITQIPYTEEIRSIFYNDVYVGTVCEQKNSNKSSAYELKAYNASGKEVVTIPFEASYKHIHATEDRILIVGDSTCSIYDYNGNLIFTYNFANNLVNLIPTMDNRELIAVFEKQSELIRLIKKQDTSSANETTDVTEEEIVSDTTETKEE